MTAVTVDSPTVPVADGADANGEAPGGPGAARAEHLVAVVARRMLHALRVGGFLDTGGVAHRSGLPDDVAAAGLSYAEERGWVVRRSGRLVGWNLTAVGRAEGERLLAAELDERGARTAVEDLHERFGALNVELLDLCTHWQLREVDGEARPNDHGDPGHDAAALDRLERLHAATVPWLDELVAALPRFRTYSERLAEAVRRVREGHTEWFTRPVIDSYHTVWFELHEDLLATLGLERSGKPVATGERRATTEIEGAPT